MVRHGLIGEDFNDVIHHREAFATSVDTSIVESLRENPKEVTLEAVEILLKLLGNVKKDPNNMKFRSIRLSNPKIESKLLVANGAFETLFSVGFEEARKVLLS